MLFGPLAGVAISFVVATMEMISFSGTGPIGALMNFASSAAFSACAAAVYIYCPGIKKKISGAVAGLTVAVIVMSGLMMIMNLIFTPIYPNVPVEVVKGMLLPLLLPFNFLKATLNAALVMMLYKPISTLLKRARVTDVAQHLPQDGAPAKVGGYKYGKKSIIVVVAAVVIGAVCVILFLTEFGGEINWIRDLSK